MGTIKYRPLTSENCRRESGLTKRERKMNLLIELYDYPCGVDLYYIQNNDVKEFDDEIVKKLREISIDILAYYFFMDECDYLKAKEEKKETISKIADCLKSDGYTIEKIFIMSNGVLVNSYTIK